MFLQTCFFKFSFYFHCCDNAVLMTAWVGWGKIGFFWITWFCQHEHNCQIDFFECIRGLQELKMQNILPDANKMI